MRASLLPNGLKASVAIGTMLSLLFFSVTPIAGQQQSTQELWREKTKPAWFSIGSVLRGGMKVRVSGSSYAQTLGTHAVATPLSDPPGVGEPTVYSDRTYDNGYVKKDSSEGGGIDPNTTWNWGYNANSTADQYDSAAGTLSFFRRGVPGYTTTRNLPLSDRDQMMGGGVDLVLGVPMVQNNRCTLSLAFGFQGIWGASAELRGSTYAEQIRRQDVTDRYNVAGINSTAFTDLNHRGTYNGPFDPAATPPYTVIPNLPTRERQLVDLNWTAQNYVGIAVDMASYQLSLRPVIGFAVGKKLTLNLIPKLGMQIADVSVDREETFTQTLGGVNTTLNRWSDNAEKTKLALMTGVSAGADLDLGKGWFAGVFGGYEWVPDKTKIHIGPNTVSLDASGWMAGLQIGKNF